MSLEDKLNALHTRCYLPEVKAALDAGGHVIGVIPRALVELEVAHTGLPDLRDLQPEIAIVDDAHLEPERLVRLRARVAVLCLFRFIADL